MSRSRRSWVAPYPIKLRLALIPSTSEVSGIYRAVESLRSRIQPGYSGQGRVKGMRVRNIYAETHQSRSISPNLNPPSFDLPSVGCRVRFALGPVGRACILSITMCYLLARRAGSRQLKEAAWEGRLSEI